MSSLRIVLFIVLLSIFGQHALTMESSSEHVAVLSEQTAASPFLLNNTQGKDFFYRVMSRDKKLSLTRVLLASGFLKIEEEFFRTTMQCSFQRNMLAHIESLRANIEMKPGKVAYFHLEDLNLKFSVTMQDYAVVHAFLEDFHKVHSTNTIHLHKILLMNLLAMIPDLDCLQKIYEYAMSGCFYHQGIIVEEINFHLEIKRTELLGTEAELLAILTKIVDSLSLFGFSKCPSRFVEHLIRTRSAQQISNNL